MTIRNKCVYLHKYSGVPFYVGKGTLKRAYKLEKSEDRKTNGTFRGDEYSKLVRDFNYNIDVEIVKDCLTESEASDLEIELYDKLTLSGVKLVNCRRPSKEIVIDSSLISKYLAYDETSPTGLVWIHGKYKGKQAGSKGITTWRVKLLQKEYYCSRIICSLFSIDVKDKVVDHIDGDGFNNKINNIQAVSHSENMRNKRKQKNNKTGITGVSFKNDNSYCSIYFKNGECIYKYFSIDKYGKDKALELAINFRINGLREVNSELVRLGENPYSDRHGV